MLSEVYYEEIEELMEDANIEKTAHIATDGIGDRVIRQASYRDGKFHDKIIMSILKEEWNRKL